MRYIPSKVSTKEDGKDSHLKTIIVEVAQKTSQKVPLYAYDSVKTFLKMQKIPRYFLAQQDTRKKHDIHDQVDDLVIAKLDKIPDGITDKKELANIKKLEDL